jgi:uncharacterized protein (DUF1697 family)
MNTYIAFLRGINVGGNTLLPMKDLAALCTKIGFREVRTYINSGNVVFQSDSSEEKLQTDLEKALNKKMGKAIEVVIRNTHDVQKIIHKNSFAEAPGAQVGVLLLKGLIDKKVVSEFSGIGKEEIKIGTQEIYVYYPEGMGKSKLKWPKSLKNGTVRNINTLTKLVELSKNI